MAIKNLETGELTHVGRVLSVDGVHVDSLMERDSYFAVVVGDDGAIAQVHLASRHWGGASGRSATAEVDATPDAVRAAVAFTAQIRTRFELESALSEARRVAKGKTVVVRRGRKVPQGTTGEVIWVGDGTYGMRVGVKDAQGTVHWTSLENVEVVGAEEYLPDWAEVHAAQLAVAERQYAPALAEAEARDPFRAAMATAITAAGAPQPGDHPTPESYHEAVAVHLYGAADAEAEEGVCTHCNTADARPGRLTCAACDIPSEATHPLTLEALAKAYVELAGIERAAKVIARENGCSEERALAMAQHLEDLVVAEQTAK